MKLVINFFLICHFKSIAIKTIIIYFETICRMKFLNHIFLTIFCNFLSHLKDVPAVSDSLLRPQGDDVLGARAAWAVVQSTEDSLTHSGRQQRRRGGAKWVLLWQQLILNTTATAKGETTSTVKTHSVYPGTTSSPLTTNSPTRESSEKFCYFSIKTLFIHCFPHQLV